VIDVLLVDWLPRGGITQTTDAWRRVAQAAGLEVRVAGRAGDELHPDIAVDRRLPTKAGAVDAHVRLVRRAIAAVRALRPRTVYVQHTWAPSIERRLLEAVAAAGSRTVLAVHNAEPHERLAGLRTGLDRLLDAADVVVAHSDFVAGQLGPRPVVRLPLPELVSVTRAPAVPVPDLALLPGRRRAVAFGVLRRGYKGGDALPALAAALDADWEMVAAGAGGRPRARVRTLDAYLSPGELRWLVESADAAVLPYRAASQSGAVMIAQSLGCPPVVSAVGGIPEQVVDGETGVLVHRDADPAEWADAVARAMAIDRVALQRRAEAASSGAARAWLGLLGHARSGAGS
jgi:glycosyltransferase involved in cell wall biosynthesis